MRSTHKIVRETPLRGARPACESPSRTRHPTLPGSLWLDSNLGLNRISNEALLVGEMVQMVLLGRVRNFGAAVGDARVQCDGAHPWDSFFILGCDADCLILITVQLEALPGGQKDKREHVTARNGGDESFFGINIGRIGPRRGHHRGCRRGGDG